MPLVQSSGKLRLLRVHDVGSKYGPPTDQIDVEVVFGLKGEPKKAFGFKLRNDTQRLAHQGMLDLLRDAFAGNLTVNARTTTLPKASRTVWQYVFGLRNSLPAVA